jgi:hypothetical protein
LAFEERAEAADRAATVLIAHDEFGEGVVSAVAARAEVSRKSIVAYRCRPTPDDPGALDWSRFEEGGGWTEAASSAGEDCGRVLRLLLEDALERMVYTRVDVFLISAVRSPQDEAARTQLAGAVRRLRSDIDYPGLVCAVIAADVEATLGSATEHNGERLAKTLHTLVARESFDYVFLSGSFGEGLHSRGRRSVLSAAGTIVGLSYGPLADALRKKLSSDQLDSARRTVALGVAKVQLAKDAIQEQLRSRIVHRLIVALLERMNGAASGEPEPDAESSRELEERIASAEWNLGKVKRLFAALRAIVVAEENSLLRDLIRDDAAAAYEMAKSRSGVRSPPPVAATPHWSRWLMGGFGGLMVFGSVILLLVQSGGAAGINWIIVAALLACGILLLVRGRRRRPRMSPPSPKPTNASALDRYTQCRRSLREARSKKVTIESWEHNVEGSVQALRAALSGAHHSDPFIVGLPGVLCDQVLRSQNVDERELLESFIAEYRMAGHLLTSDNRETALRAVENFAEAHVAQIRSPDWPHLAAHLATGAGDKLEGTWLDQMLWCMRRASTPLAYPPDAVAWEILLVPGNTPAGLIDSLRAASAPRNEIVSAGVDELVLVQAVDRVRLDAERPQACPI